MHELNNKQMVMVINWLDDNTNRSRVIRRGKNYSASDICDFDNESYRAIRASGKLSDVDLWKHLDEYIADLMAKEGE